MKRQVRHCFQSFLDPTKCNTQEEDCWTESIAGFDLAVGHLDTLCGWIVGRAALHMETLTEEQVGEDSKNKNWQDRSRCSGRDQFVFRWQQVAWLSFESFLVPMCRLHESASQNCWSWDWEKCRWVKSRNCKELFQGNTLGCPFQYKVRIKMTENLEILF